MLVRAVLLELIKPVLERRMKAELADHLGYEKNYPVACVSSNSRNGPAPRTVHTEVGHIQVGAPRDRAGTFKSALISSRGAAFGWLG